MLNNFFPENRAVYEMMWRHGTARQATDDKIIRRMRIVCWITKATNTYSEYIILIAFSLKLMVTGTCPNVTLYVRCLSFFLLNAIHDVVKKK